MNIAYRILLPVAGENLDGDGVGLLRDTVAGAGGDGTVQSECELCCLVKRHTRRECRGHGRQSKSISGSAFPYTLALELTLGRELAANPKEARPPKSV